GCETKIFLPFPSYCVLSLLASKSRRSVGSRLSTCGFFPAFNAPFPPAGRDGGMRVGRVGAAAWALEFGVDDPVNRGRNWYTKTISANTPRTAAQIVFFLLSNPSCTTILPLNMSQVSPPA